MFFKIISRVTVLALCLFPLGLESGLFFARSGFPIQLNKAFLYVGFNGTSFYVGWFRDYPFPPYKPTLDGYQTTKALTLNGKYEFQGKLISKWRGELDDASFFRKGIVFYIAPLVAVPIASIPVVIALWIMVSRKRQHKTKEGELKLQTLR